MATHPRLAGRTLLRRRSVFVLIFYAALLSHHPTTPPKPFPAESNAILATVTLLPGSFEKELAMRIMRVFAVGLVLGALILIASIVYGSVVHQGPRPRRERANLRQQPQVWSGRLPARRDLHQPELREA